MRLHKFDTEGLSKKQIACLERHQKEVGEPQSKTRKMDEFLGLRKHYPQLPGYRLAKGYHNV